jgi:dTDP-4-dehydrorhamnose reductase
VERIVILGSGGRLGAALQRAYAGHFDVVGFERAKLDLNRLENVRQVIEKETFDLLINCAALTAVDYCEGNREEAFRVNREAPGLLAEVCRAKNAQFVHISTDYVFDGEKIEPYTEEDEAKPISVYGESKLAGECRVLETLETALVVRVSWVFGPDRPSFIDQMIRQARENKKVAAVTDKFSTPSYTIDIAEWLKIAWKKAGILHLANAGECSWREYAQHALDCCKAAGVPLQCEQVDGVNLQDMKNFIARRPVHSVLATEKLTASCGVRPRSWREAVAEYVRDYIARI